jgi:hypothetical protein
MMVTIMNDDKDSEKHSPFEEQLFEKAVEPFTMTSTYIFLKDVTSIKSPGSLPFLLGIDKRAFSNRENDVLKLLEDEKHADTEKYVDFKWKILAFLTIQDIFDAPLFKGDDLKSLFQQWYFYYESKYVLTEMVLCGLNGFHGSMGLLLRLFLEFNIIQNYYYRNINDIQSYRILENYFSRTISPNWNTIINKCMEKNDFTKPIKRRLQLHLQGLSESSNHPYHPMFSPKLSGSFIPEPTLERLFFYCHIAMILEPILWLYYTNFPMLFHPVNIEAKFGFNGPVGLFIDEQGGQIIKRSLSNEDYNHFGEYSKNQEAVRSLMEFYNGRETLTEEEIHNTWDKEKEPLKNIIEGHGKQMATMRGLRESMSFRTESSKLSDMQAERILNLFSYDKWRNAYKKWK